MLKIRDRKFPTRASRLICQSIYGHRIHNSTWASWRECVGIGKKKHWVTGDQLLEVCAIAYVRRTNRRGELSRKSIRDAEVEIAPLMLQAIEAIDKGKVLGADIDRLCENFVVKCPSQSTLYRRIEQFSRKKYYPVSYILQVA